MEHAASATGSEIIDPVQGATKEEFQVRGRVKSSISRPTWWFGYVTLEIDRGRYLVRVSLGSNRSWSSGWLPTYHQACAAALAAYDVQPKEEGMAAELHILVNAMANRGWEPLGMSATSDGGAHFPLRARTA